ncbi:MAG: HlyD family secretion protein [Halothiobacillus sp.]|nr:HlyD family secretion protein [Halothiobacillus sp.]
MNQTAKETKSEAPLNTPPEPSAAPSDAFDEASETQRHSAPSPRSKASRHRLFLILFFLLLATWLGLGYLRYNQQFISTEDAFINGNQTQIGPEVSGLLQTAPWQNNTDVQKGDVLFTLDPTPYQLAVDAAKAGLSAAKREQQTADAAIITAQAELLRQKAAAQQARDHLYRLTNIKNKQFVSEQALSDARSALAVAKAAVEKARAQLDQTKASAGVRGPGNDRIKAAQAKLAQAEYNLSQTVVRAPMSGRLANYSIETGQPVSAHQTVCSIVATTGLWVDANVKETELGEIRVGQPAQIESDIYPGHVFKGHVLSIAAGAGNAFSLLPPQNATGNWVKVTQRVPVRIVLDDSDTQRHLPIGTSTTTRIELTKDPESFVQALLGVIGLGGLVTSSKANPH